MYNMRRTLRYAAECPSQTAGVRMYNKDIHDNFYWQPGGPPCSAGPSGTVLLTDGSDHPCSILC